MGATCSICSSPPDILREINEAIRKKETFRDLAARTAFSRAALHRHSQKCLPHELLSDHARYARYDPTRHRVWVEWPDGRRSMMVDARPQRAWWNRSAPVKPEDIEDVTIEIQYEKRVEPTPEITDNEVPEDSQN